MLRRKNRLSRSRDFERVYRAGRSVASRYMVLYYFPRSAEELEGLAPDTLEVRVGFSVSKRLGNAVDRNRIKRCLREVFRLNEARVKRGVDLVFIARGDILSVIDEQGISGVEAKMVDVLRKGGLLAEPGSRPHRL